MEPFKDRILKVDVEENMKTSSMTQRQVDPVERSVRLDHIHRNLFDNPMHRFISESLFRHFKLSPMSNQLSLQYKRGTLLVKTEETDLDVLHAFLDGTTEVELQHSIVGNSQQDRDIVLSPDEPLTPDWSEQSVNEM